MQGGRRCLGSVALSPLRALGDEGRRPLPRPHRLPGAAQPAREVTNTLPCEGKALAAIAASITVATATGACRGRTVCTKTLPKTIQPLLGGRGFVGVGQLLRCGDPWDLPRPAAPTPTPSPRRARCGRRRGDGSPPAPPPRSRRRARGRGTTRRGPRRRNGRPPRPCSRVRRRSA